MAKVDPTDFLLNTDYEMDKVILVETGSYTQRKDIAHSLSFTPLVFGVWSTMEDFTVSHTLGETFLPAEPGYTPPLGVNVTALSDKIILKSQGQDAETTKIYYRIYAFAPSGAYKTPTTSKLAQTFMMNTDYNYRKIMASGEFTQPGQTFTHNLGYLPQIMAWTKYTNLPHNPDISDGIDPLVGFSFFTNFRMIVTPTTIQIVDFPTIMVDKIIWRIYYDKA